MAYDIPVAALVIDEAAAAALLGKPADFFEDEHNDRRQGVEDIAKITGAPVQSFACEDESVWYMGVRIVSDFRIDIDGSLALAALTIKRKHDHPLIQSAQLAVVSEFC